MVRGVDGIGISRGYIAVVNARADGDDGTLQQGPREACRHRVGGSGEHQPVGSLVLGTDTQPVGRDGSEGGDILHVVLERKTVLPSERVDSILKLVLPRHDGLEEACGARCNQRPRQNKLTGRETMPGWHGLRGNSISVKRLTERRKGVKKEAEVQ